MNSLVHRVGTNNIILKMIMVIVMMCKFVNSTGHQRKASIKTLKYLSFLISHIQILIAYKNTRIQCWHKSNRDFNKNFCSAPNWFKSYKPTASQSTMMNQSYSISIEELNHVMPKWSNRPSKVGHLVFSLGQWYAMVAHQTHWKVY